MSSRIHSSQSGATSSLSSSASSHRGPPLVSSFSAAPSSNVLNSTTSSSRPVSAIRTASRQDPPPSNLSSLVVAGSGVQIHTRGLLSPTSTSTRSPTSPISPFNSSQSSQWSFSQGKKSSSPKKSGKESGLARRKSARSSLSASSSPSKPINTSLRSSLIPPNDVSLLVTGQSLAPAYDMSSLRQAANCIPTTPDSGISSQFSEFSGSPYMPVASLSTRSSSPTWSPASDRRNRFMAFGDDSENKNAILKKPRVDSGATCTFERMVKSCSSDTLNINPLIDDIKQSEQFICIPRPHSAPTNRSSTSSIFAASSARQSLFSTSSPLMIKGSAFTDSRSPPSRQSFLVHREEVSFSPITTSESEFIEEQ